MARIKELINSVIVLGMASNCEVFLKSIFFENKIKGSKLEYNKIRSFMSRMKIGTRGS
jgi:hypothetical protein